MRKLVTILTAVFLVTLWVGAAFANGDAAMGEVKVSSKYNILIYGKLKFDTIYDTNDMGRDEFITYVPKNADGDDRTTFNVRDTRLGIAITGPSLHGWNASGRFETDFYGYDPSSNGSLRIRLAYVNFKKGGTQIRIGQDWNQIASLNPSTVDFAIMGYNGNLWNRVPQITLTQDLGGGLKGLVTVYRYRDSDDDDKFGGVTNDVDIHMPWVGGKLAYSTHLFDSKKKAYLAISGAVRDGEANDNDVTPYVAACELKVPFGMFELTGEGYMGQGLGLEYFHHNNSFNDKGRAILTRGGFGQLKTHLMDNLQVNLGYGGDDPKDADAGDGIYQYSEYTFGNVMIDIMEDITAGFEVAYVETKWAAGREHGTRYQTSLWYNW
jgi:hypothetical protein